MTEGLFFITIISVLIIFFLFVLMKSLSRIKETSADLKKREESKVGFVVDTFHELMAKLKEKERELEELHKKAEERADVMESYNEYILQSVPSGVISLDRDLVITKINAAAGRILNIAAVDVQGKRYDEIFRQPLKDILDGKTTIERGELVYTTGSGKSIHLGITVTPLLNAARETIGRIMVFTDLTELKALEAQAELRDRLSSLGEMAAGMAHELRNPMAVIAGYTKILSKKVNPSLNSVVESVSKEVGVMDRIIADFLSFARPTELSITPVDLEDLIRKCVSRLISGREDISIRYPLTGIPPIEGDDILLRQAFTNLIQNAIEAMPHGGNLGFDASGYEGNVEIAVSDSGHGIPENIRNKIFLPFYTTKDSGTGLGLAIVHKIITVHRGSITVSSSERGTTFRVALPLHAK